MTRHLFAVVGACALALGCRSALGIDELGLQPGGEGGGEGGSAGREAGDSGAGGPGTPAAGGSGGQGSNQPGGSKGAGSAEPAAGGANGSGGASGRGGSVGGTGGANDALKVCQQDCVDDTPDAWVGKYFDAYAACACGDGGLPSCAPLCGSCDLGAGGVDGESAACIACIARKAVSADCAVAGPCAGHCDELRECLAKCGD